MNKYLLFLGLLLFVFISCSKKKDSTPAPVSAAITTTDPEADPPQYGTPYSGVPATTDIILYEINERAFSATGNFAGITARLDSIKALGANVIWLMPINPIGVLKTVGSPYCVKDFRAVNSEYGTLEDLRTLINAAHSKNMAVILDWAANQTSWDNAWITAHKNWYLQDGSGNIVWPPGTGFKDVAQLDYTNMDMRAEMIKDMKYWIHIANFDGFRCDYADHIPDSFWAQAIDTLTAIQPSRQLIFLAEGYNIGHLNAGFQMVFGEGFYSASTGAFKTSSPGIPQNIYTANTNEYNGVVAGKQRLRFTTTHDHSAFDGTPMTLFGGKQGSLAAAVATFYMAGVPLIYGSQEVGTTGLVSFFNNSTPIDWTANPDMVVAYKKIIALRSTTPALKTGSLTTYTDPDIVCFTRTLGPDTYLILVNLRNSTKTFTVPTALQATWTDAFDGSTVSLGATQGLTAYQYIVLK